jgi:hypothetical protein
MASILSTWVGIIREIAMIWYVQNTIWDYKRDNYDLSQSVPHPEKLVDTLAYLPHSNQMA